MSPARFELTAPRLGIWCSILLSYGDTGFLISAKTLLGKRQGGLPPTEAFHRAHQSRAQPGFQRGMAGIGDDGQTG